MLSAPRAGEGANMVVIPNWQNAADGGMAEWQVLVKVRTAVKDCMCAHIRRVKWDM